MSQHTIGWVLDRATSTRRLHLYRIAGGVGVAVEGPGPLRYELELDQEGLAALWYYVNLAASPLMAPEGA